MAIIIPGIHNYCDRWCERCLFVNKCSVGIAELKMSNEAKDINNEAFWDNLGHQFKMAIVLLDKEMNERGIVVTEEESKKLIEQQHQRDELRKQIRENHPLPKIAMEYSKVSIELLEREVFESLIQDDIQQKLELGIADEQQIKAELLTIKDSLEVIQWYNHFIWVKSMRALSPGLGQDDEEELPLFSDKNGSAKIVLLAVEASLGAWHKLFTSFPTLEDEILTIMAMLQKIMRLVKEEFPNAMSFIRPGFDEGWQQAWDMDEEEDLLEEMEAKYQQYMLGMEEE